MSSPPRPTDAELEILAVLWSRGPSTVRDVHAAINKRRADTLVLLNEGERLVIGGVTQTVSSTTIRKVPYLGDIPFLGWAFKQRENFETGRELAVFLTPSVLKGGAGQTMSPR